jgi:hypothetical protein
MPVISYLPHLIQCLTKSCTINLESNPLPSIVVFQKSNVLAERKILDAAYQPLAVLWVSNSSKFLSLKVVG